MIREPASRRTLVTGILVLILVAGAMAQTAPPSSPPSSAPPSYTPKSADDHALSTSEANSIAYMKTLFYNERQYQKKMNRYSATLLALTGGGRSFTKRMAATDRRDYVVAYHGGKDTFSVTLTPKQFDATRRGFYMDASGVIRVQEGAPATAQSEPLK